MNNQEIESAIKAAEQRQLDAQAAIDKGFKDRSDAAKEAAKLRDELNKIQEQGDVAVNEKGDLEANQNKA